MIINKYTRPKLPRNKYGINNKQVSNITVSNLVSDSTNIEIDNSGDSSNTTTVTNIYNTSEWYTIQTKLVHGKQYAKDSNGNIIYVAKVDERGENMYDNKGELIMIPKEIPYKDTWVTVIENFDTTKQLRNSNEYRFLLMRFRKGKREGKRWRIPFFSAAFTKNFTASEDGIVHKPNMTIAEQDTWWAVEGSETRWWNSSKVPNGTDDDGNTLYRIKTFNDVIAPSTKSIQRSTYVTRQISTGDYVIQREMQSRYVFLNNKSAKMLVGVALFKKSNKGAIGWEQVSNIATMQIRLSKRGSLIYEPNK